MMIDEVFQSEQYKLIDEHLKDCISQKREFFICSLPLDADIKDPAVLSLFATDETLKELIKTFLLNPKIGQVFQQLLSELAAGSTMTREAVIAKVAQVMDGKAPPIVPRIIHEC